MDFDPGASDQIGAQGSILNFPGGDGGTTIVDHSSVLQFTKTPGTNGLQFIDIGPSFGHKGGRAFVSNSTLLTEGRGVLVHPSGGHDPTDPFFCCDPTVTPVRVEAVAVVRNSHLRGTTPCSPLDSTQCATGPIKRSIDGEISSGIGGRTTAVGNLLDGPAPVFIHAGSGGECVAKNNKPATQNNVCN